MKYYIVLSFLFLRINPITFKPYGQIGLYLHSKGSKIESQNFEYGGGLLITILRFPYIELSTGYQAYNRNHQYNNAFLGIRYTLPLSPIYYY